MSRLVQRWRSGPVFRGCLVLVLAGTPAIQTDILGVFLSRCRQSPGRTYIRPQLLISNHKTSSFISPYSTRRCVPYSIMLSHGIFNWLEDFTRLYKLAVKYHIPKGFVDVSKLQNFWEKENSSIRWG
jgi:hypothetical protein